MLVHGKHYRTIWLKEDDPRVIQAIDQRYLPHSLRDRGSGDRSTDVAVAIADMHVRGAGLIGATAGYGMYLAALHAPRRHRSLHGRAASRMASGSRPPAPPR